MAVTGMFSMIWHQTFFKPHPLPPDVRLHGQTAIVTGSNVGLGFEAAKELAEHGVSRLILAVRNTSKGEAAKSQILSYLQTLPSSSQSQPPCVIEVWPLDQESYTSIIAFASRAAAELERLDMILLNAGLKLVERRASPDTGHETHVQVNHLGTALLSLLILPTLRRTTRTARQKEGLGPARLSITASSVYGWVSPWEVQRPEAAEGLLAWLDNPASFAKPEPGGGGRYSLSKLLCVMWARELAGRISQEARHREDGDKKGQGKEEVIVNVFNPGYCMSEFHRVDPTAGESGLGKYVAWTAQQGGYHLTDAVVMHPDSHGKYLSEQRIQPISKFVGSPEGKAVQEKLWNETMALFRKECPGPHLEEFEGW
ncbi:short-chain dehydrogenase/reductase SDR [Nemania sp. FL0031]|nr:short-chain dehydrogenase/reductase SDR [Nemania sp. FL0031]